MQRLFLFRHNRALILLATSIIFALAATGSAEEKGGGEDWQTPIGDAHLAPDGTTIIVNLRRTVDSQHVSGSVRYLLGDPYYEKVMKHIGGLKPGETKLVLPFRE
jgi:hypothetical protein